MEILNSKEYKKYLKDIKSKMLCSSNIKLAFISEFKENVKDFLFENPDSTMKDILEEFKETKEIADSFKSQVDIESLHKKAKKYLFTKLLILILFALFVLSFLIILFLIYSYGGTTVVSDPY
ncbi:MAG: hypothetical protein EOM78_22180 [Erysipelotrichia bacterium]|nr:hypothetical protein [Erysipelotrichia bacterium]